MNRNYLRLFAIRRSRDGAAGTAEGKRQPWHASIPPARSIARRASLPGAGGRHLPLQGGVPSKTPEALARLHSGRVAQSRRSPSLPGAGGRHLPLQGGVPSTHPPRDRYVQMLADTLDEFSVLEGSHFRKTLNTAIVKDKLGEFLKQEGAQERIAEAKKDKEI